MFVICSREVYLKWLENVKCVAKVKCLGTMFLTQTTIQEELGLLTLEELRRLSTEHLRDLWCAQDAFVQEVFKELSNSKRFSFE